MPTGFSIGKIRAVARRKRKWRKSERKGGREEEDNNQYSGKEPWKVAFTPRV